MKKYKDLSEARKSKIRGYSRKQYHDNKELAKARHMIWLAANPEYSSQYRSNNIERCLLTSARGHAKRDGVLFDLELEDVVIPERCPIFDTVFDLTGDNKDNRPSLDKVVPELGYVPGNVRVISWRANRLKHNMKLEEVQAIERYIKEHIEHSNPTNVIVCP